MKNKMITEENIQSKINNFMQKLKIRFHGVYSELYDEIKNRRPAYSVGAHFFGAYVGGVFISKDITNYVYNMTEDELDFIIAHELSHILLNHYPISVILELPNILLKRIEEDWTKITNLGISLIKLIMCLNKILPPKENIKKNQEIEADIYAVYLIDDNKEVAISCLNKLAKGNLSCGSHFSKILDRDIPILSYDERITAIKQLKLEFVR